MFSDAQLRNWDTYLKVTPKSELGKMPPVAGAYDAAGFTGARGHGFAQRRRIPGSAFSRGGAFDYAQNGENNGANAESEADRGLPRSGQVWKKLERTLSPLLSTEQMSEVGQMLEDFAYHCGVEAKAEKAKDGENDDDDEAMDKRRRARDGEEEDDPMMDKRRRASDMPPPGQFSTLVRSNSGSKMAGRAGDARPGRVSQSAADSFQKLFPGATPVQRV